MFSAFLRLDDAAVAYLLDVGKAHVRHGSAPVETTFLLHLQDDVFQSFFFILVKGEL